MAENNRTENTAVNRLIEMAQSRPAPVVDDGLFERPRPTLPPPFPARGGLSFAPSPAPEPMSRRRVPNSTQTMFESVPDTLIGAEPVGRPPLGAAPATRTDPTEPFDVDDLDGDDSEDLDDALLLTVDEPDMTVAEMAPVLVLSPAVGAVTVAPAAVEPMIVAPVVAEPMMLAPVTAPVVAEPMMLAPVVAEPMMLAPVTIPEIAAAAVATPMIAVPAVAAPEIAAPASAAPAVASTAVASSSTVPVPSRATAQAKGPIALLQRPVSARGATEEDDHWFQPSVAVDRVDEFVVGTQSIARPSRWRGALWLAVAFGLGVATSALIAWPRGNSVPAAAPAPTALPPVAVAPPVVVAPLVVAPPEVAAPAAVKTKASAPPAAKPVRVAAATKPTARPAAKTEAKPAAKSAAVAAKTKTKTTPATKVAPPAKVGPAAKGATAMLLIGAKPPCDIYVDGKRTGLKTPQRALPLTPGDHKITLVNKQYKITETFSVTMKAGASTKVIKDLTNRMK